MIKTLLLAGGLLFAPLIATSTIGEQPPIVALAETSEEFQEKTYTYSCEEGVSTLVLTSETEFTMTMAPAEGEPQVASGTYTRDGNVLTLVLMGNELVVVVDDETMTFDQYVAPEDEENNQDLLDKIAELEEYIKNQANEIANKEIIAGITIGGLISFALMVLSYIIRIKYSQKKDKIQEERNNKFNERLEKLESYANSLIEREENIQQNSAKFLETSCNELNAMKTECSELLKEVQAVVPELKQYEQFNKKLTCVINVLDKMSYTPENVKLGIAEEIKKLVEEVK